MAQNGTDHAFVSWRVQMNDNLSLRAVLCFSVTCYEPVSPAPIPYLSIWENRVTQHCKEIKVGRKLDHVLLPFLLHQLPVDSLSAAMCVCFFIPSPSNSHGGSEIMWGISVCRSKVFSLPLRGVHADFLKGYLTLGSQFILLRKRVKFDIFNSLIFQGAAYSDRSVRKRKALRGS